MPSARVAAASQAEWSWLQQPPHSRAGSEEAFSRHSEVATAPWGGGWRGQPLSSPGMKMAAGCSQIPEASGQALSSRWDVWGQTGHKGGYLLSAFLSGRGQLRAAGGYSRRLECGKGRPWAPCVPEEVLRRGSPGQLGCSWGTGWLGEPVSLVHLSVLRVVP